MDKAAAIKSILADMKKGLARKDILHKVSQQCTKDDSTLRRWWVEAEKEYVKFQERIAAKEAETIAEIDKTQILSQVDRMLLLSKFAKGEITVKKQVVTKQGVVTIEEEVSIAERRNSMAELNKMDGAYNKALIDLERAKNELNDTGKEDEFNGFELDEL